MQRQYGLLGREQRGESDLQRRRHPRRQHDGRGRSSLPADTAGRHWSEQLAPPRQLRVALQLLLLLVPQPALSRLQRAVDLLPQQQTRLRFQCARRGCQWAQQLAQVQRSCLHVAVMLMLLNHCSQRRAQQQTSESASAAPLLRLKAAQQERQQRQLLLSSQHQHEQQHSRHGSMLRRGRGRHVPAADTAADAVHAQPETRRPSLAPAAGCEGR